MKGQPLSTTHPGLAKQWHPTLNGDKTPDDITYGSPYRAWWSCGVVADHIWKAPLSSRASKNGGIINGCPCCDGKKAVISNCLATTHPELAAQWHPTLNSELTPYNVTIGSHRLVWWFCNISPDHIWQATVHNRRKTNCPCCVGRKVVLSNCLATTHPELAKQWHPTLNGDKTPYDVVAGSRHAVWWFCSVAEDHIWKASSHSRTTRGCPCCNGKKVVLSNCLATTHPELAKQWHSTLNGNKTTYDVTYGSHYYAWWVCDIADDHIWQATVNDRTSDANCPYCDGKKVALSNCLVTTHPELSKQWHRTKNNGQTPYNTTYGSGFMAWWQCSKNISHEWRSRVADCAAGSSCPICASSKGESAIEKCLVGLNILYKTEHKFDSCKFTRPLLFDFVVYCNGGMKAIEYQGLQHYEPSNFGSKTKTAEDEFDAIQKRDSIKRQWCHDNGISLLEIPYWDFDKIDCLVEEFILG